MNKNLTKITKSALAALPLVVMLLLANIVNAQNPIVVKFANNGNYKPYDPLSPLGSAYDIYTIGNHPVSMPSNVAAYGSWVNYKTALGLTDESEFIVFHVKTSVGSTLSQTWSFDGDIITNDAPTTVNTTIPGYSFTYPGVHSVTLTVTDANGGSNSQTIKVKTIGQNPKPVFTPTSVYGPNITTVTNNAGVRQPGVATVTLNANASVAFGNLSYSWDIKTSTDGVVWSGSLLAYDPATPAVTSYVSSNSVSNPQITVPQPATGSLFIKYTVTATDVVGNGFISSPNSASYSSVSNIVVPGLNASTTPSVSVYTQASVLDQVIPATLPILFNSLTAGHSYKVSNSYSGCSEKFVLSVNPSDVATFPSGYILTLHTGDGDVVYNSDLSVDPFETNKELKTGYTLVYNNPNKTGYIVYFDVKDKSGNLLAVSGQVKLISTTGTIPLVDPAAVNFTVNNDDVISLAGANAVISNSYLQANTALINLNATVSGSGNYNYKWSPVQQPTAPANLTSNSAIPTLTISNANSIKSNPSITLTRGGVDNNSSNLHDPNGIAYTNGTALWLDLVTADNVIKDANNQSITPLTPYLPYKIELKVSPKGCPASVVNNVTPYDVSNLANDLTPPTSVISATLRVTIDVPLNDAAQTVIWLKNHGSVSTYPNPVISSINVNTTVRTATPHVIISVYDVAGNLKSSTKVATANKSANTSLSLAHLSTGFYKVTVTNAEGQVIETKSIFKN